MARKKLFVKNEKRPMTKEAGLLLEYILKTHGHDRFVADRDWQLEAAFMVFPDESVPSEADCAKVRKALSILFENEYLIPFSEVNKEGAKAWRGFCVSKASG